MTKLTTFANIATILALTAVGTYAVAQMWSQTYDNINPTRSRIAAEYEQALQHAKDEADYFCNESRAVLRGRKYFDMCEEKTKTLATAEYRNQAVPGIEAIVNERDRLALELPMYRKAMHGFCGPVVNNYNNSCEQTKETIRQKQKRFDFLNDMLRSIRL